MPTKSKKIAKNPVPPLPEPDLGAAIARQGGLPDRADKAAYEAMIQSVLADALDMSFRERADKLANVPGMTQAPDDPRMIPDVGIWQSDVDPFVPGMSGWQDTASSGAVIENQPVATYAQQMGLISQPFGRPAGLNRTYPAVGTKVREVNTPKKLVQDEPALPPEMFAPQLPPSLRSSVPHFQPRLNVAQAPYEHMTAGFGHGLGQLLGEPDWTNIEFADPEVSLTNPRGPR